MNYEIQDIISGKSQVRYGTNIQTVADYIRTGEKSSALDKSNKHFKREETERLRKYIDNQRLWIEDIDLNRFVSEGAEQAVASTGSATAMSATFLLF